MNLTWVYKQTSMCVLLCNYSSILNLFVTFEYIDRVFDLEYMIFDNYLITSKSSLNVNWESLTNSSLYLRFMRGGFGCLSLENVDSISLCQLTIVSLTLRRSSVQLFWRYHPSSYLFLSFRRGAIKHERSINTNTFTVKQPWPLQIRVGY